MPYDPDIQSMIVSTLKAGGEYLANTDLTQVFSHEIQSATWLIGVTGDYYRQVMAGELSYDYVLDDMIQYGLFCDACNTAPFTSPLIEYIKELAV